jgi:hypothetical protein
MKTQKRKPFSIPHCHTIFSPFGEILLPKEKPKSKKRNIILQPKSVDKEKVEKVGFSKK